MTRVVTNSVNDRSNRLPKNPLFCMATSLNTMVTSLHKHVTPYRPFLRTSRAPCSKEIAPPPRFMARGAAPGAAAGRDSAAVS